MSVLRNVAAGVGMALLYTTTAASPARACTDPYKDQALKLVQQMNKAGSNVKYTDSGARTMGKDCPGYIDDLTTGERKDTAEVFGPKPGLWGNHKPGDRSLGGKDR